MYLFTFYFITMPQASLQEYIMYFIYIPKFSSKCITVAYIKNKQDKLQF